MDRNEEIILRAIRPNKYVIPNNKMANAITNAAVLFDGRLLEVEVNNMKNIITTADLSVDENIKIGGGNDRITPYDKTVHNAVCSIFEAGNEHFTTEQVYRVMNGLDNRNRVSPQAVGAVTKSIDKMARLRVEIDYTEEAKERHPETFKNKDRVFIESNVLAVDKITVKAGGHSVTGYKLLRKPPLYEYAQFSKQVLSIENKLLNTSKAIKRTTTEITVIREYLIRRMEYMKSGGSNRILFQRIYEEIGQAEPTRKKAMQIRKDVASLLDFYKSINHIKKYSFYKKGRSFEGAEIKF